MGLFNRIFLRSKLENWVSEQTLAATDKLHQLSDDLMAATDKEVTGATLQEALFRQTEFLQQRIAPMIRDVAEPAAYEILEEASLSLIELVGEEVVWHRRAERSEPTDSLCAGAGDVVAAAVPLAAGVATAVALPFAAVTTSTSLFGLFVTTTISWPIVVGGGAFVGLGMATGILNTAKIRDRAFARLRARVRRFILEVLVAGSAENPSILQQLVTEFQRAAKRAQSF